MRVTYATQMLDEQTSDRRTERGATLVIVAIVIVVLLGMAALVVDLGNGWQSRRHLITATDAAALAAAQDFALDLNGCREDGPAYEYVLENFPDVSELPDCRPGGPVAAGWVTVTAEADVATWFAGVIGGGDYNVSSASTARWGSTNRATGLRPIALCGEVPGISDWLLDTTQTIEDITIPVQREAGVAECDSGNPSVPGNWGLFDFDGPSGNDSKEWIVDGYDGVVQAGTLDGDCTDEDWACDPPQNGYWLAGLKTEMDQIVGLEITLPVINYVIPAGGVHGEMHIIGFANVIITSYKRVPANKGSITVTFLPGLIEGECCDSSGGPSNVYVVQPCAIDNREVEASCSS